MSNLKASHPRVQPLASQFTEWVAALDSRPREKQAAIGVAIVAGLFAWFAIALGSPALLVAVPALGGVLYGGVRTKRRLHPAPSNKLLSRISLATPPLRVGRSSGSYIYEPTPEPEFVEANDEEPDEPQESGERFYEVCETVAGRSLVRHSSPSLFGATDYALELHMRSRGAGIEVLRVRDDVRESVVRFSGDPPEGSESAKSPLDVFGYPVTRWKGPAG